MQSPHPCDAWIDLCILPMILSIGMLYHSLLENMFHRKTMTGLCVNPCATSLALYLTTSSIFTDETHFDPTRNAFGGVDITVVNTSRLLSECNSTLIVSFHLIQPER